MNNNHKDNILNIDWQLAYVARELRHNKSTRLNCPRSETPFVIEQLNQFSNFSPTATKTIKIPNSDEVYLEIID